MATRLRGTTPRPWLTFSNAVSLIALFIALGGSAYAAGVLPANSVGRSQLRANAVTSEKLAPNSVGHSELQWKSVTAGKLARASVGLRSLDPSLRAWLVQRARAGVAGARGPVGPQGATGSEGRQGPSGPGASRVHYSAQASASPSPQAVAIVGGLKLNAECQDSKPGTQLNLSATSDKAATIIENINVDNGPVGFAEAHSANLQINLPEGTTVLGGPSVGAGEFNRIIAHLVYIEPNRTVDLTIALVLDGTARTCAVDGVGVPATE
jgi:hypothetical protein